MEKLDIRRGYFAKVEGDGLFELMKEIFGNCKEDEGWYRSDYGAMRPISIKVLSRSELAMEINTADIPEDQVLDTMRKRNIFLEKATGYTSKERLKKLKEKAKSGKL
ncbi:MAG: DUF5611 family protein [Candidatus Thermoplasmatota archaeon]|nr:DUF5611 family protein [Candidatus Thermoplasmatota archaeon]